ncbi:MAG: hypothetical protein R3E48_18500 [Burkholderiaceae bacterium]
MGDAALAGADQYSMSLARPMAALSTHLETLPYTLALWLRPFALSIEHDPKAAALPVLVGLSIVLAMGAVALGYRHRRPIIALGLMWPLLALLPTHSFIARLDPVVEKPLYLAWVGPSLLIGYAVVACDRRPACARPGMTARRSRRPRPRARCCRSC